MARAVAHVFVADLSGPVLADEDVHHLDRVLRLRPGETVTVSDGQGGLLYCEWAGPAGQPAAGPCGVLRPLGDPSFAPPAKPALSIAFALTKGQNPELAVQKLTEAGVDRIVVMSSARCVARWQPASQPRQLQRLRHVARQAAMQSRRTYLPTVEGLVPFASLAGAEGVALASPGGAPLDLSSPTLMIGPEGGWDDEELAAVARHVTLGPHVLRAGTAAIAAGVLMAALRSGIVSAGGR